MFTLVHLHNGFLPVHVETEFLVLYAVKVIGSSLQIILITLWARLFLLVHVCHPNSAWIFIVVLVVNLPPQILEYFSVLQEAGIIRMTTLADEDLLFQSYNLSRVWTVFFVYYINIAVALERLCAMIYLSDYERVVRPHICFGLILLTIILATFSSYYLLNELGSLLGLIACMLFSNFLAITQKESSKKFKNKRFPLTEYLMDGLEGYEKIWYLISLSMTAIQMYWYVVSVTNRQHEQLFRRSVICIYSLSERYQIIENFRIFKLCKSLFISASSMNLIGCLIFIVPYVSRIDEYQYDLWKSIFIAFLNVYAIPVLICPIFVDEEMGRIFKSLFRSTD